MLWVVFRSTISPFLKAHGWTFSLNNLETQYNYVAIWSSTLALFSVDKSKSAAIRDIVLLIEVSCPIRRNANLNVYNCINLEGNGQKCLLRSNILSSLVGPKNAWQFIHPISFSTFELLLQVSLNNFVDRLLLAIGLRVRWRRVLVGFPQLWAKSKKFWLPNCFPLSLFMALGILNL